MRALKGLLIYIGIVLAIIFGMGILLFAAMFFIPSFRILGVGVVHGNHSDNASILLTDYSGYSQIDLSVNSKNIDLQVVPAVTTKENKDADNYITADLNTSVFGLAYNITEYSVIKKVDIKDNVLKITINITEPNGMISYTGTGVVVTIPHLEKVNLSVNTEKGVISVGGSGSTHQLNLSGLNVTTTSGNFSIANCYHDLQNKIADLSSMNLTTKSGTFSFENIENLSVDNKIKLNGSDGRFVFKNIIGSLNIRGSGVRLEAKHIKSGSEGFEFFCDNGVFKIQKLESGIGTENSIVTENCNINIEEVYGNTGIFSTFGNVDINTLHGVTLIKNTHGNVKVNHANEDLNIDTEYGNITVESYKRNGIFTSKRGNINVKSTSEYEDKLKTKIINEDGEINVDNKINKLLIETTGKSKVSVIFREIKGGLSEDQAFQHRVIIADNGHATVYLPTINLTPFKFKALGNITGEISGLVPEYEGNKVKSSEKDQFFPKASEENIEECRKSCYFEFLGNIHFAGYQNV